MENTRMSQYNLNLIWELSLPYISVMRIWVFNVKKNFKILFPHELHWNKGN